MTHGAKPTGPTVEELAPWFHNLHLPDGRQTRPDHPFGDFPAWKWAEIAPHLPPDMTGLRCLDIGCNSGFYSFELARRGAEVVGIDINDHFLRQARWAAAQFGLAARVTFENRHVYDYARRPREHFDVVLFMGVFYHLRYPMLALDTLRRLDPQVMVFQTLTTPDPEVAPRAMDDIGFQEREILDRPGWPRMAFIENALNADPTNWWVPNRAAVIGMLRAAAFRVAEQPGEETYICRPMAIHSGFWQPDEFMAASGARDAPPGEP